MICYYYYSCFSLALDLALAWLLSEVLVLDRVHVVALAVLLVLALAWLGFCV